MRSYTAAPSAAVSGAVTVPGDKSVSHRALLLSAIATGTSEIDGFLPSEDCLATLSALRALGVQIGRRGESDVQVQGVGLRGLKAAAKALDMGNAGTAMRLFTGLLSAQVFSSRLVGDASLMARPMERVAAPLRQMGADVRTNGGRPPVEIRGGAALHGIDYSMPVASAQVKSALLLAGLYAQGVTSVRSPAISRDHSERMLEGFGAQVEIEGLTVRIHPPARLEAQHLRVPGDFSSAAFFIVAGLLGAAPGGLKIGNVGMNPTRTGLLDILRRMGAQIEVENARASGAEPVADLLVRRSALRGIVVPPALVALSIDEFPVLFIAAACAEGETLISGAEELRLKESDRIAVMSAGLRTLGVTHETYPDGMRIAGRATGAAFDAGEVDSGGDHRAAMSFSVASLRAAGPIVIRDVANVATSFPGYVQLACQAGLVLHES
jgi:3-phosphoshikimate 1-carboxyvinyltransferase